ncbi:MAG: hypothetical protein H0V82_09455 [Candidatus Protochlamydia sp.]|nr:hypothetical protein [Candidatus Protochlamydia sp.]
MGALKFILLEPRIVFDASLTGGLGGEFVGKSDDISHEEAYEMMKLSIQKLEETNFHNQNPLINF